MKAHKKVKIKLFVFDLIFELIMIASIGLCAWYNNKIIETVFFYIAWLVFRFAYPKIYHYKQSSKPYLNVLGCLLWSNFIFWVVVVNMTPISRTILVSVFLGILINFILYKIQDYFDLKKQIADNTLSIYKMSEEELRTYATSKGLSEMIIDTLVLRVIHNYKWVEIQRERNYTRSGIRYHKDKIKEILKIEL